MTKGLTRYNREKSGIFKELVESKRSIFWLMMFGFMALIFVRNVLAIEFPIVILLAYFSVMALFFDRDETIALAVSCVPFSAAFQYRYALLALMVIYLIKFPKSIKRFGVFIPIALMMFWELLHGVLPYDFSLVAYLQQFTELIFCAFVMSLSNKKFDYPFIARVYALTTAFCATILMIKLLQSTGFNFVAIFLDGRYRLGINDADATSYVLNYNPNALGLICNLGICALLLRIKKCKNNFLDMSVIFLLAFYGFLTLSRSFILCLAMIVLLYFFSVEKNVVKIVKTITVFTIFAVVAIVVLYSTVPYVFDNLFSRFGEEDITNGRSDLFVIYNEHIFASWENSLFGLGVQNILPKMEDIYTVAPPFVPHNGFQEIVVGWGFLGIILFLAFVLFMIFMAQRERGKLQLLNLIPIILVLVAAQAGQLITSGFKLVALTFAFVAMCADFDTLSAADSHNKLEKELL